MEQQGVAVTSGTHTAFMTQFPSAQWEGAGQALSGSACLGSGGLAGRAQWRAPETLGLSCRAPPASELNKNTCYRRKTTPTPQQTERYSLLNISADQP